MAPAACQLGSASEPGGRKLIPPLASLQTRWLTPPSRGRLAPRRKPPLTSNVRFSENKGFGKLKSFKLIAFFFLLQVSPILVYWVLPHGPHWDSHFYDEKYEQCVEYYVNRQVEIFNEMLTSKPEKLVSTVDEVRADYTRIFKDTCHDILVLRHFTPNYSLFTIFCFFVIPPISWICALVIKSIRKHFMLYVGNESVNKHSILILIFIKSIIILTCVGIGALIVWGWCLPELYVPSIIKNMSLVIGLTFLISLVVLTEAFGRAFAYSGIHAPQNALKELEEELMEK